MKNHIIGLLLGGGAGLIDCAMAAASGMPIGAATLGSAVIFWMAVGWAIHNVAMALPSLLKGMVISLFMNIPWILEFVGNQGASDLLVPMLILGIAFGAILGLASGLINKRQVAAVA